MPMATHSNMKAIVRRASSAFLTAGYAAARATWLGRPRTRRSSHALAVTPRGRIVLVKLRYAKGWRLPGGGRKAGEQPRDTVLRELREEIGMVSHGAVRLASQDVQNSARVDDVASFFIVHDVRYEPRRWSLEVEAVRETSFEGMPTDLPPRVSTWLDQVQRNAARRQIAIGAGGQINKHSKATAMDQNRPDRNVIRERRIARRQSRVAVDADLLCVATDSTITG